MNNCTGYNVNKLNFNEISNLIFPQDAALVLCGALKKLYKICSLPVELSCADSNAIILII